MTITKPILFSGPMVRALLDGRKTQTRRMLKPQPVLRGATWHQQRWHGFAVGDRLWVRESWQGINTEDGPQLSYRATPDYFPIDAWDGPDEGVGPSFNYDKCPCTDFSVWGSDLLSNDKPWRPGIHMPRWASRLTLEVTRVKVQRVQDISEQDAIAEGCGVDLMDGDTGGVHTPNWGPASLMQFCRLWSDINGKESWDANPWVVALTFTVHHCHVDAMPSTQREGVAA